MEVQEQEEEKKRKEEEKKRKETIVVGERTIECPICGHDRFTKQKTLMNTRRSTLVNLDWTDAEAETCICQQCGYVLWFRKQT